MVLYSNIPPPAPSTISATALGLAPQTFREVPGVSRKHLEGAPRQKWTISPKLPYLAIGGSCAK